MESCVLPYRVLNPFSSRGDWKALGPFFTLAFWDNNTVILEQSPWWHPRNYELCSWARCLFHSQWSFLYRSEHLKNCELWSSIYSVSEWGEYWETVSPVCKLSGCFDLHLLKILWAPTVLPLCFTLQPFTSVSLQWWACTCCWRTVVL